MRIIAPLHYRHSHGQSASEELNGVNSRDCVRKFFAFWQAWPEVECEDGVSACVRVCVFRRSGADGVER